MAINSVVNFIKALKKFPREKEFEYYFRGHSDFNFTPLPSIYRTPAHKRINPFIKNEDKIFREVILRTPSEFNSEKTTIEKLVKMQHYGLPTRILDITSNPLVALYFACTEKLNNNDGEVIVLKIPKNEVKFYDSDTVSILANLSKRPISFDITEMLDHYYQNESEEYPATILKWFNDQDHIAYLLHEIKDEKPHFQPVINPSDFNKVIAVKVKLNNSRILKQGGAFLLFGVTEKKANPAQVPSNWILNKSFKNFNLKILAEKKNSILKDLDALGINDSTLYPELEKQTKYIKQMYSN